MMLLLAALLLLLAVSVSPARSQGIVFPDLDALEERCDVSPTGAAGWCRPLEECPPMIQLIQQGGRPNICGYRGVNVVVCCPVRLDPLLGNSSLPVKLNTVSPPRFLPDCGRRPSLSPSEGLISRKRRATFDRHLAGRSLNNNQEIAVVGGFDSADFDWPWTAQLGHITAAEGRQQFFCSAVLINSRWMLTAAHCITAEIDSTPLIVRLRVYNLFINDNTEEYTVARVVTYPDYTNSYHDIALLELTQDVTSRLLPICLPWGDEALRDLVGGSVTITGWGATSFGAAEFSLKLQEASIRVFPSERCDQLYSSLPAYNVFTEGITNDTFICAGKTEGGVDTCQGDSGGPLVYAKGTTYILGGIVSKGYGCGHRLYPGLYVPIARQRYMSWIKDVAF